MRPFIVSLLVVLAACAHTEERRQVVRAPVEQAPAGAQEGTLRQAQGEREPVKGLPFEQTAPLHTVVLADAQQPIISLRLVFRTGSIDDPKGREGLTALTAAVLEEGGTKSLSSAELLEALFPMAAELSMVVDKELTTLSGRVHRDHLDRFLEIFTEVLLSPRFDPNEFERLKSDAVNRIRNSLRNEDIEQLGKVGLDALLYQGHPLAHFVGGTVSGLLAITLEDVKAHAARVFTQDRLIVGLAGPIDAALEKKVLAKLQGLPAKGAERQPLPSAPGLAQHALILEGEYGSTAISMGYVTPLARKHPDFFPVAFALSYLGEHRQFNGVLFNELREQRGLNYGTYAYAEHFVQEGWSTLPRTQVGRSPQSLSLWIRPVVPENGVFATRAALYFLDRLVREGIPEEQFELTRGFLKGYTRLFEQTDQRRLGYAIDSLLHGTPDFLEAYRSAMEKMTPEAVHEAVKRHLSPSRMNFVFVTKDAQALTGVLVSAKPTPITYATEKPEALLEEDKKIARFPVPVQPARIVVQPASRFME